MVESGSDFFFRVECLIHGPTFLNSLHIFLTSSPSSLESEHKNENKMGLKDKDH